MALEFGTCKDPAVTIRVEQFWDFAHVWGGLTPKEKGRAFRPWHRLKNALMCPKTRWMRVAGLMGATVATSLDIGWDPLLVAPWWGNCNCP
eukprot:2065687-Heterocapsa_arctica.AAC.1